MEFFNDETKQFIRLHRNEDPAEVALHRPNDSHIDFKSAIEQIAGYRKAKEKLPYLAENEDIIYPKALSLEQCSSETTANFKAEILSGETLADLTGGFGVDSMAFSKHYKKVLYIEKDSVLCGLMTHNCEQLGIGNVHIINASAEDILSTLPDVDVIYLDPSRRDAEGNKVYKIEHCVPNILPLLPTLLQKAQKGVLIKLSPMADIKDVLLKLQSVSSIIIVSVKNECKEFLCVLEKTEAPNNDIQISAVEIDDTPTIFSFTPAEEAAAKPAYTNAVGKYLYEPYKAVLKAGAFKLAGSRFCLEKLHPHTHLYTSDQLCNHFPGNVYIVEKTFDFRKADLKYHLLTLSDCSVKVRNFPLSVEALSKRLKIHEGTGAHCLFATTNSEGKHILISATRI